MNRRGVLLAAATVVAAVLVVGSASARPPHFWRDFELSDGSPSPSLGAPETVAPTAVSVPPLEAAASGSSTDLGFLVYVLWGVVALLAGWVLWWLAHRNWHRTRRRSGGLVEPLPEVDVDLSEAAEELDEVLARGSPRNAIVACWARLEDAVEEAGIHRRPSETSEEMTTRVLSSRVVDAAAIESFAALYREARFSTHDLTEQHRAQAQQALEVLRGQLRASVVEGADL